MKDLYWLKVQSVWLSNRDVVFAPFHNANVQNISLTCLPKIAQKSYKGSNLGCRIPNSPQFYKNVPGFLGKTVLKPEIV